MLKPTLVSFTVLVASVHLSAATVPGEWIDPDTGHRIVRLSREPGSESLYFHQNAFTAAGDKMVITTPEGISVVNWKTRAVELLVPAPTNQVPGGSIVVGRKNRLVYYNRRTGSNTTVYATHMDTGATREIGRIPGRGTTVSVNADETLLVGTIVERDPSGEFPENIVRKGEDESKGHWMARRLAAGLPMKLFTMDTKTGASRVIHESTDWLNHVQFSPGDPGLIMLCHEGPWHLVERTWTIRTDGTGLTQIHPRRMEMEIGGHEFFSADGRTIWYDLQTPRGQVFWLAGYDVSDGGRTWYLLQRDEWSVHYNVSSDGKLFAGDGGHEGSVAHAKDGKWIYLFHPEPLPQVNDAGPGSKDLVKPGVFRSERLVNMKDHDYGLEPNVNFTPDGKWIVFRSNMFGSTNVFAVEVAKAAK
jgi:oligogalacturonide lyase